ncbi:MAG: MaoC family dehydratase N-terminal domain-containing protein, partial [Deltaproteobacteria bacterium]|nr:MaoC family dehydratase N-terminal domain-containing protein [Deltaproteobacteria bacterium]
MGMQISQDLVGSPLRPYCIEVSWRNTMNYAAAIDDHNPHYFDDERESGVVAPPMFSVAVTWPISERIEEYINTEDLSRQIMDTKLHYTEHLEFHRIIKPCDKVTIQGEIAAIFPHRDGTHLVVRYEAIQDEGTSVFTEHIGFFLRGVKCTGSGRGENVLQKAPRFEGHENLIWKTLIPVDLMRPYIYDGCTNIFFPIHTSKKFAHQVGLSGTILQGTATLAYAVRELINRASDENPLNLRSVCCRFTAMVFPGTHILVQL